MNLTSTERIALVYLRVLKRAPTSSELAKSEQFIQQASQAGGENRTAWQSLCRVLVASNEFSYIE